jgi:hypothetical protein
MTAPRSFVKPLAGIRSIRLLGTAVILFILFLTGFTGCNQTAYPEREPTFVHNVPVDSIVFWPAALRYARTDDTVSLRVMGFKRGYACTNILEMGWSWLHDSTGDIYSLHSLIEIPGNPTCAVDGKGVDSTFRISFPTTAGQRLYLRTSAGNTTDSLLYLSGKGTTETFTHRVSAPDSLYFGGRFLFHDSGATRTRRFVTADSMATCETFQSAAFKRNGDTLTVRVRRIEALPLSASLFPPCAGPHADTVEVVFERFRFP